MMFNEFDSELSEAEDIIRIFLLMFPLLAGHFELNSDLLGEIGGLAELVGADKQALRDLARKLAARYAERIEDESYAEKDFVRSLHSITPYPRIKKPILDK